MENIKKYLASANSGDGFYSHFNYINEENGFTYILKGGPGTGKSTLMKKVGEYFYKQGKEIEFFYCSSDAESLDGVRLKDLNISIVDGTAPHVTEATMPAVKERIVNLGDCINSGVAKHKKEIEILLSKKARCFELLYLYLRSAKLIYKSNYLLSKFNEKKIEKDVQIFIKNLGLFKHKNKGKIRRLFNSYLSTNGKAYLVNKYEQKFVLNYSQKENDLFLQKISLKMLKLGYKMVFFCDILLPQRVEAICIEDLNILICSNNNTKNDEEICNNCMVNKLLVQAGNVLQKAREIHKEIECYYVANLDIKKLNKITNILIREIKEKTQGK